MTALSKIGPHIGEGAGNIAALGAPRYAKTCTRNPAGDIPAMLAASPGTRIIWRWVLTGVEQAAYLADGQAGGERLARDQLAILGPAMALVWAVEGLNECVPSGDPTAIMQACEVARGHARAIRAAGLVAIEFNVAVGNVEEADALLMAPYVQELWEQGDLVGYHAYWDQDGPMATWAFLAGRYQQITAWLRAAGVTAVPRWALTEGSWDVWGGNPQSGPLWELIGHGLLTTTSAQAQLAEAYRAFDGDPLVEVVTAFTWWHRSTQEWRNYDLAVRPNGQPYQEMLDFHRDFIASPHPVVDPPPPGPVPPPLPERVVITAASAAYIRADASEAHKRGTICRGEIVDVLGEDGEYYQIAVDGYVPKRLTAPA